MLLFSALGGMLSGLPCSAGLPSEPPRKHGNLQGRHPFIGCYEGHAFGIGLLVAALYVRFRDVVQIWELTAQLLFFASAIFYPIGILPAWAQKVAFLNPFVQVMQDVRHAILGGPSGPNDVTVAGVYGGAWGRLIPISIAVLVFLGSLAFFRREGRFFAERV